MKIINSLMQPLFKTKARVVEKTARDFVSGKVVDIGAGRCLISQEIEKNTKAKVTPVDVYDLNQTSLKLILYDGRRLPFNDNSFDTALVAYVLHHCDDPISVLQEAKRVCRGNLIIFEDIEVDLVEKAADFVANRIINPKGINMPYNFKSKDEWLTIFKEHGLKTVEVQTGVAKEWFYPFAKHVMFVVKK